MSGLGTALKPGAPGPKGGAGERHGSKGAGVESAFRQSRPARNVARVAGAMGWKILPEA
ncbi:MAG: hypothetical protein WBF96_07700 [Phycisphaerae bacterium]